MTQTFTPPPYAFGDPDRAYATGAFIPGAAEIAARWPERAAAFRAACGARARIDLLYGAAPRARYDVFEPEGPAKGTSIFIHGGYWLAFDKSTWSHLAAGLLARGWRVVIPSYTLAPDALIAQMTQEIAALCRAIRAAYPGPLTISGHSAGGHLAARMICDDIAIAADRVVPISPLAELAPLIPTQMNLRLGLTPEACALESPARRVKTAVPAHIWLGAEERPAFYWQARSLAEEWRCPLTLAPARHHYDVVEDLCQPSSELVNLLAMAQA